MRIKIKILLIYFLVLCFSSTISNAAIEIKPGTTAYTSITVSDSFDCCKSMDSTSTLGNNDLNPHLTLNADWAAVAYLALSPYGTVRSEYGEQISIGSDLYYTTTSNITGVMSFGKTFTHTASYREDNSSSTTYMESLIANASSKYVEVLSTNNDVNSTRGQAFKEVGGWFSTTSSYPTAARGVAVRKGVYNISVNTSGTTGSGWYGNASSSITFRPVIWNKKTN